MSLSRSEISRRWRQRHPDTQNSYRMKHRYGITVDDYNRMLAAQGGRCAICKSLPVRRRLDVDHDHQTGKVRGLLCHMCNTGIAKFHDDTSILRATIDYLQGELPCH